MRIFVFATVLSLAAAFAWTSGSAVFAQVEATGAFQICDGGNPTEPAAGMNPADAGQDVADDCQEGRCAGFRHCLDRLAETYGHDWTFTADILAVQRDSARSQPLAYNAGGAVVQNAKNMDFPVAAGLEASAICHDVCGFDVEVGYVEFDSWIADDNVWGTSYPVYDATNAGAAMTGVHDHYASAFHAGEINLRRQWCCGLTLLAGFRSGELDEMLTDTGFATGGGANYFNEEARTFNHLYGCQLGADWEFFNSGVLRINAKCKAGIYDNVAIQSTEWNEGASTETLAANRNQLAFMGEAGLTATYQWTRHVRLHLSAQAVWLNGVALAPEQIGAINFAANAASIDTHGEVFYCGGGGGVEVTF